MRIPIIKDASRAFFINNYLRKGLPCVFRGTFSNFPALSKWITPSSVNESNARLNLPYFLSLIDASGKDPLVDVESGRFNHNSHSRPSTPTSPDGPHGFFRTQIPLSLFLRLQSMTDVPKDYANLYLAQTPLLSCLPALSEDCLPKPEYLPDTSHIYGSSAWIGKNTFTPRHFDPNENLYVMVGGKKKVVLWEPSFVVGDGKGKRRGGLSNDNFSPPASGETPWDIVVINAGDGLYIPERWWHEVESLGTGVAASVNWWFREPAK
ncbi:hypothetical protein V1527DRAFT_511461 [Lipomyces starkeyi]